MKRIFAFVALIFLSCLLFAQKATDNTLRFLGIPVDGTEQQMIAGLKEKGFRYNSAQGYLTGQFNGESVKVYIHTNHNVVDRVYVAFPTTTSVSDIRNKFNRLISQFDDNNKYVSFLGNEPIPMDEDVSYEMSVHDKRYEASYRYANPDLDPEYAMNMVLDKVTSSLPEEEAKQMRSMMEAFMSSSEEEQKETLSQQSELLKDTEWTPETMIKMLALLQEVESALTGQVWFTIHSNYGRYNIGLYYDNLANRANGEDL